MSQSSFSHTRIEGVISAVPFFISQIQNSHSTISELDRTKISKMSGVKERRITKKDATTADLCYVAAKDLLQKISWDLQSVDALIFVSQTPDYLLPATACSLQERLGLSTQCAAFDVNLGCSGYTYALWLGSALIESQAAQRVLLLVGDTISKITSPEDRSTAFLFGDAGTATALGRSDIPNKSYFIQGTDGKGVNHLIVPGRGFRLQNEIRSERVKQSDGNVRSDLDLYMNGGEIFNFTIQSVPKLAKDLFHFSKTDESNIDSFIFHQANEFMLKHLAKKMNLPSEKVPLILEKWGNTSSASIPLTICHSLSQKLKSQSQKLMLMGFGVGYSWSGCVLDLGPLKCCDLIEAKDL